MGHSTNDQVKCIVSQLLEAYTRRIPPNHESKTVDILLLFFKVLGGLKRLA